MFVHFRAGRVHLIVLLHHHLTGGGKVLTDNEKLRELIVEASKKVPCYVLYGHEHPPSPVKAILGSALCIGGVKSTTPVWRSIESLQQSCRVLEFGVLHCSAIHYTTLQFPQALQAITFWNVPLHIQIAESPTK